MSHHHRVARGGLIGSSAPDLRAARARCAVAALVLVLVGVVALAAPAGAQTTWLCRPGQADDACLTARSASAVDATGAVTRLRTPAARRRVDCFYVYPTVSGQRTLNADLRVDPILRAVAAQQASRFSSMCDVYAPVYRQVTVAGLLRIPAVFEGLDIAYRSMRSAWREYLARLNRGRGVVLIGHSQGTGLLRRLMREEVDRRPAIRRRLVSALLLGGNVKVRAGRSTGGDFAHIPACRRSGQFGCVVGYSSYLGTPPERAVFGRVGAGFDLLFGGPVGPNLRVLCTNPAALAGGSAALHPYFPGGSAPGVRTPWATFPGLYRARCRTARGITWLDVDDLGGPRDPRPRVSEARDPARGLHLVDVNIALGDLVSLAARQAGAWLAARDAFTGRTR